MFQKILILAPHTDDGELGCGGTIAKFVEEGKHVYCAAFSIAEESVPAPFSKDRLANEFKKAMNELGVVPDNIFIFKFKVRSFLNYRQQILDEIILLREKINPDLVLLPSSYDIHQDHEVITKEGLRAFKKVSILGYELPWNNIEFGTRCFIKLSKENIQKKINALHCYETQKHRSYLSDNFIWSLAITRGTQFENEFAEAFETVRFIIK